MEKDAEIKDSKFLIKSYWLDFQAHPNHPSITPSIVLSSTHLRTDTPAAIVYFHYSPDFTEISAPDAHKPNLYYLHYHISMLEVVLRLLKSGEPLECYIGKGSNKEQWGGINLKNEIYI